MVEYAYAVIKNKKCMYLNFTFIFTKECDCMNKREEKVVEELGTLFSFNSVALDKATVNLLNKRENKDIIKDLYPHIEDSYQFHYAHSLGTGELSYQIKEIK